MKDLNSRKDIEQLVRLFYEQATTDELIGHYFTSLVPINWDEHIPTLVSFWENLLFQTGGYKGGMLFKHLHLNHLSRFRTDHFDRWLQLWKQTIDQLFEGERAEELKFRASSIAMIMQTKLGVYDQKM